MSHAPAVKQVTEDDRIYTGLKMNEQEEEVERIGNQSQVKLELGGIVDAV